MLGGTGNEKLASWLRKRAKKAGRLFAVEEALLAGRFWRYAVYRLTAFSLARFWALVLHVVELTWLAEVFSAKSFVASLALQNVTLVIDAAFFGALETMRRRARALGPGTDATALTTRWLTAATWLALLVGGVPCAQALWDWSETGTPPTLLHLYGLLCFVRLAADLVLRAYYSGVFAHQRVYRPLWMPLITPTILVGGTLGLWRAIGVYAFAVALAASTVASRLVLYVYTRRAYRMRRIPTPRWQLRVRWARPRLRHVRDALLAAAANTTARIGAVVLVAAIIPSLRNPALFDEDGGIAPFAFALHLASPLLFLASQWWLVFYHDWKRLEGEAAAELARELHGRLLVTATIIGVVSWAGASTLVLVFVPLAQTWQTLLALVPAMIGVSIWTALQLRVFARGEFVRQVASAAAMLLALTFALSGEWLGYASWYVALGAAPWLAIVIAVALERIRSAHGTGELDTVPRWVKALGAARGDVVVWTARTRARPSFITARIAAKLGDRGAAVRVGSRMIWFERAPFTLRGEWLACGAGTLMELEEHPRRRGRDQAAALEAAGVLRPPQVDAKAGLAELARAYGRIFPEGFVVHVGRHPPPALLSLPPPTRQAIWRDAVRAHQGTRSRSGWFVTVYAPRGAAEVLFLTKRPVGTKEASEWHGIMESAGWRIATQPAPPPAPQPARLRA